MNRLVKATMAALNIVTFCSLQFAYAQQQPEGVRISQEQGRQLALQTLSNLNRFGAQLVDEARQQIDTLAHLQNAKSLRYIAPVGSDDNKNHVEYVIEKRQTEKGETTLVKAVKADEGDRRLAVQPLAANSLATPAQNVAEFKESIKNVRVLALAQLGINVTAHTKKSDRQPANEYLTLGGDDMTSFVVEAVVAGASFIIAGFAIASCSWGSKAISCIIRSTVALGIFAVAAVVFGNRINPPR